MIEVSQPGGGSRRVLLADFLPALAGARHRVVPAFDAGRVELVAALSSRILKLRPGRTSPGVTHFAYWTRRAALRAMAVDAAARTPLQCIARPRGVVFHLPPQNVETVFLYSWLISFLAGNANVTRLPTDLGADMEALLDMFIAALAETGDRSQFFVRYPVSEQTNREISASSDARVVWGGDAKVEAFSHLPLRKGGKSIWFGDRRSLALVDGSAVAGLDAAGRRELAGRLHNDIFVFDQMACSSPQRLYVVGDRAAHANALTAFMKDLSDEAIARGSLPASGHAIQKMVSSMGLAARGRVDQVTRYSNALTTVVAKRVDEYVVVGGGFLEIAFVPSLQAIHASLTEGTQTAVHFGFSSEALDAFARALPPYCLTRIVPIGQALNFDVVWDGYDLMTELTSLLRITP